MLNRVQLIGNLTRDPELRYSPDGTPYCYLRVATNHRGSKAEYTEFHFVIVWRAIAERCAEYLHVGNRVFVEGRLETNAYATPDGARMERARIVAGHVLFLSGRAGTRTPGDTGSTPDAERVGDLIQREPVGTEQREPVEDSA
jgi:single-strand DNA-binding protein